MSKTAALQALGPRGVEAPPGRPEEGGLGRAPLDAGLARLAWQAIPPFWGLALGGTTLAWALLCTPWLVVFGHIVALTAIFHLWHVALHDPRSGPLYRQHQRHHQIHSGRRFLSAHYHSDEGLLQELTLLAAAALLLFALALLGSSGRTLCTCAVASLVLVVGGGWLHRAMHIADSGLGRFAWFRLLRRLHLQHHVDPSCNLGIIECGLDALRGSLRLPRRSGSKAVATIH